MRKKKVKKKVRRKKTARKSKKKKALKGAKKKVAKGKGKPARKTSIPAGASLEEVGIVTHYFPRVDAAVLRLTKGTLLQGDTIIIKGHTTDFKEKVKSMQLDHVPITSASVGQEVGLKVKKKVRDHDVVYKLVS